MHEQVQFQQSAPVAVARTAAAADLVTTMLQAHGLQAWTEAYAGVYPSVEWVEGHRVLVADADEATARSVLKALDRDDARAIDDAQAVDEDRDSPEGDGTTAP